MPAKPEKQKRCSTCKKVKAVSEFYKCRAKKDGLQGRCKVCHRAGVNACRKKNAARNAGRAIDPSHKKRCSGCGEVKAAGDFTRNRTAGDGLSSQCKECNSTRTSKWKRANKDRAYAYHAEYRKANPDKYRAYKQRRRARKANAEGSFTADEWKFTLKVLDYRCIYCNIHKDDTPEKWLEADHLTPLSRGGNNYIDNIAPACKSCNCSKGTKTFDEFIDHLVATGKL